MIGAVNAEEEDPEEEAEAPAEGSQLLNAADGLPGGGVAGGVVTNGLAAAFGEACMILGPAGTFMAVSDGARDASGAIDVASVEKLETGVNTYEGTQTERYAMKFFNIKIIIRSHIKQEMDKVVQVKKEA